MEKTNTPEQNTAEELLKNLNLLRINGIDEKYKYYDGDVKVKDFGISTPVKMADYKPSIGWASRAVDMVANKMHFDGFENDELGFNDLFEKYGVNKAIRKVIPDVMIGGCSFLAITTGPNGPVVLPFSSREAYGQFEWATQNLRRGVVINSYYDKSHVFASTVNDRSKQCRAKDYTLYEASRTTVVIDDEVAVTENSTGRPLMGLLTYNSNTNSPMGRSRVNRVVRQTTQSVLRTIVAAEISAQFFNSKFRYILGIDENTTADNITTEIGKFLTISNNEEGDQPKIGELSQQQFGPFTDEILMFARQFCTDTKLTLKDLSLDSSSPASADALMILSDDLMDLINNFQTDLSDQIMYFATTLYMHDKGIATIDATLKAKIDKMSVAWKSPFRLDIGATGDAMFKLDSVQPELVKTRAFYKLLGFDRKTIDDIFDKL